MSQLSSASCKSPGERRQVDQSLPLIHPRVEPALSSGTTPDHRWNLYRVFVIMLGYILLLTLHPLPVSADGGAPNLAYVAGAKQGIAIIDILQRRVTGTIALDGNPQTLYLSNDGRFLYVTQPAFNQVSMIAAKTGQVLCTAHVPGSPSFITFDAATSTLFVAGSQATTISNLDLSDCHMLHTIQAKGSVYGLAAVGVAAGSGQLWVSTSTGLELFATGTGQPLATLSLPGSPRSLTIPQGASLSPTWAYVTTLQGYLYAIDLNSHHMLTLLSSGQFGAMDFDEVTGEIYVPDRTHRLLDVLTPPDLGSTIAPQEPNHIYHLDAAPQSVAITSDGAFGFVALSTGQVAMLDIAGKHIVNLFTVGGNPHFVLTGLYPPILGTTPQQAFLADIVSNIAIYALVVLTILLPLWFTLRWSRKRRALPS